MRSWYTAEEITRMVQQYRHESLGEAVRWLTEGAKLLRAAQREDRLDEALTEPETSIDTAFDTLVAAVLRHRCRTLGVDAPDWTYKPALRQMWFVSAVKSHRIATAINLAPPELRRVGIMIPETALTYR